MHVMKRKSLYAESLALTVFVCHGAFFENEISLKVSVPLVCRIVAGIILETGREYKECVRLRISDRYPVWPENPKFASCAVDELKCRTPKGKIAVAGLGIRREDAR